MDSNENVVFSNSFGKVSETSVIINRKNDSEEISLWQIAAVSFVRKRSIFLSFLYFFIAIVFLSLLFRASEINASVVILVLIFVLFFTLIGIAYFLGNHQIRLEVLGTVIKSIKVEMSRTKEGRSFAEAIQRQMIST